MKTVAYSSPFVPPEWIAAHGLRPWRVLPGENSERAQSTRTARGLTEGACPFSRAFMDDLAAGPFDAAILATTCDQMRRAGETLWPPPACPMFLMNVPVTWQSPAAAEMYLDELRRLGRFLVQLGGKAPGDDTLTSTMLAYQRARQELLERQDRLTARQLVETIFRIGRGMGVLPMCGTGVSPSCVAGVPASCLAGILPAQGHLDATGTVATDVRLRRTADAGETPAAHAAKMAATHTGKMPVPRATRTPLAVVGGPMSAADLCVLDMIEQCGGQVAMNASESGTRCLPATWDARQVRESPLVELAKAYFGAMPDAFRRPDDLLYEYLKRELSARQVRGIVLVRQVWCDLWHAQSARIRSTFGLPLLDLDVSCPRSAATSISNRIASFLEMLR